jgi:hypothetical protein
MLTPIARYPTRRCRFLTIVVITVCAASVGHAQDAAPGDTAAIAPLIEAARESFSTPQDDHNQVALTSLREAVGRLDAYLEPGGENGRAWKRYLEWSQLQAAIADGSRSDAAELASRLRPFQRGFVGLELPIFTDVVDALDRLATYTRQVEEGALEAKYNERLDTIAAALAGDDSLSGADSDAAVLSQQAATAVDWLARHGQAGELVAAIHQCYRRENVLLRIDGQMVRAVLDREIDETNPVRDNILGTRIRGTSQTTGRISSALVPSDDEAVFDIDFTGAAESLTTGYNGPARIRSAGTTTLDAHTRVLINASGLSAERVQTDASTKTKTLSVGSKRDGVFGRFITKIARKKVAERKGESELVAAAHAADQFSERMDERFADLAARVNSFYFDKVRHPLSDRHAFPDILRLTTSSTELLAVVLAGRRDQFAAPTPPPAGFDDSQLEIRLHESAVNNLASSLLAGREFTNDDFRRILTDLLGDAADKFLSTATEGDASDSSWGIKFAAERPLSVHFAGDVLELKIRGERFVSNDKAYAAMDITARYQLVADGDTIKAVRQGELVILPPDFEPGKRLKIRQITLKQLLQRRLNKVLKPELVPEGIELTGELSGVGTLRLTHLVTQDGWLAAGWQREVPAEQTAQTGASPTAIIETAAAR